MVLRHYVLNDAKTRDTVNTENLLYGQDTIWSLKKRKMGKSRKHCSVQSVHRRVEPVSCFAGKCAL